MTNILGLDVCKASVVACLLAKRPDEPRQFYYNYDFQRFEANASGIKAMLNLEPDIALMEPTGVNYSKLWGTHLAQSGVEVRLVGHKELKYYRANHLMLPDKDDEADALALACYGFDYLESPRRFVQIRDFPITRIRELVLRLAHLNRVQSPIINRLRQDLAWQFPEVAHIKSVRNGREHSPLLFDWLAGIRPSEKYDRLYAESAGLGLNNFARHHARRISDLQQEEIEIERELKLLLSNPIFAPYRRVFKEQFGFGQRVEALILSQIYPVENFMGADGKPEVVIRRGRVSGKPTRRHLSRRRFEKALGCAPTENSSGDMKRKKVVGGSDLCRKALWQWVFTRVEPARTRDFSMITRQLGTMLDEEKAAGRPVQLVRSRVMAKAAKLLFKALVEELE
jgi:transposase